MKPEPQPQRSERPKAGDHNCEYPNDHEVSRCKHCGLTSREAIRYFEQLRPQPPATDDRVKEWKESGDGLSVFCGNELVINMRDKTNYRMQVIRLMEAYRRVKEQGSHADAEREKVRKLHLPASSAALYDAFEEIKRIRQQLLQAEEKLKQYESNKS
jgi:DNA-binding helix-hairpin-helix protein with protein kinase domain